MKNAKIPAWGMIGTLALAVVIGMSDAYVENWDTILGLGLYVFGIWSSIILIKNAK